MFAITSWRMQFVKPDLESELDARLSNHQWCWAGKFLTGTRDRGI